MEIFGQFVSVLYQVGIGLGVGASTVALTLFLIALRDNTIDTSERRMLHGVYGILRVAMGCIAVSLLLSLVFETVARDLQYALQWALFAALCMNAVLMTYHKVPMKFAPALQGATWYALMLVTILPIHTLPLIFVGLLYISWIAVVYLIIRVILNAIHE